jgi:ent-kaurene oxidase
MAIADDFVKIVARVSSRMFGGTDLSRHKEWVDSTINFAVDGFIGAQAIKKYPPFIRPLARYWIPELSKISQHHATARRVIVPILKARKAHGTKPVDFLQWMLESARREETEEQFIASIQLKLSFAAIHTSAAAPTQLLYDLCARPEYIAPLLCEIEEVMAEHGVMNKQALLKLVKMDSFMKESQRFNPLLLSTFISFLMRAEHIY